MRVRHVMNKQGSALERTSAEQATSPAATPPNKNADPPAMASTPQMDDQVVTLMDLADEGTPSLAPKEEDIDASESPWTGDESPAKLEQIIQESFDALLHSPEKWFLLNKRLNKKHGRDVLFGVEDVIKAQGPAVVREKFLQIKPRVDADLIWSLHQPLLSLMLFILRETNDIHKKLIKVPDLKSDICRAMGLGRPSRVKPSPAPKPKLERAVKKLKGSAEGKKKLKKKKVLAIGRPSLKIKKRPLEDPDAAYAADQVERKPSKEPKPAKLRASGDPPLAKKRKLVAKLGDKTFHQLIASSQERDRSGKFAPGFSPAAAAKLKKVIKKSIAIKTSSGGLTPKLTPRKKAATGGTPKKKVTIEGTPKSRKQLSPKLARASGSARALPEPLDEALAYQPRATEGDSLEDAEIAALVCALRARGAREARGREELAVLELDERISDLEVAQRKGELELVQLRARRQVLLGESLGKAGEQDVAEPVKAARDRCLQAIVDLLDVLPASLDLNAVDVFNELEHTDAFDATLGALASKQRVYLQRDWDRKNALAAEAKRAELEAMRKKNNVRQHLGILAASSADETTECDAIFGAFQLKLIKLRQEMERKANLLVEKENIAKQAWLVYRAAA